MTSRNSISCQADLNEIETEYDNEYEKFEEYNLSSPHSKNPLQFSLIASEILKSNLKKRHSRSLNKKNINQIFFAEKKVVIPDAKTKRIIKTDSKAYNKSFLPKISPKRTCGNRNNKIGKLGPLMHSPYHDVKHFQNQSNRKRKYSYFVIKNYSIYDTENAYTSRFYNNF